jgi:hypothetical protein
MLFHGKRADSDQHVDGLYEQVYSFCVDVQFTALSANKAVFHGMCQANSAFYIDQFGSTFYRMCATHQRVKIAIRTFSIFKIEQNIHQRGTMVLYLGSKQVKHGCIHFADLFCH